VQLPKKLSITSVKVGSDEAMNSCFLASMDQLHEILRFVCLETQKAGFKGDWETKIELALEESIVNIIKYAYPYSPGQINIQCTSLPEKGIKIVLIDTGIPFNPLIKASEKDLETLKKTQSIGGYGIFLMLKIMDNVEYEHKEGCNILTLTKFLC